MNETRKEVLDRLMQLQTLLHRHQMHNFMSFGPWGNPNRGQGRVLALLKMKPRISQKELGYLLDMSKQSLAELLLKLEKNGYIKREPSEEDHRSFTVTLTEEGAAAASDADDTPLGLEKMLDNLNDDELTRLSDYLARIIKSLEDQASGGDDDDLRREMMKRFREHRGHSRGDHGHPFDRGDSPGFVGGRHFGRRPFGERHGEDDEGRGR